jgi:hypothetical protein
MILRCPCCKSSLVRLSRRRKLSDFMQLIALRLPLRCRECRERFYGWFWLGASTEWTLDHFMEWNQNPDPDLSAFFIDCLSVFLADGAMESHRWEASACR